MRTCTTCAFLPETHILTYLPCHIQQIERLFGIHLSFHVSVFQYSDVVYHVYHNVQHVTP